MNAIAAPHPEPFSLEGPDRIPDRRGTQGRTPAAERFVQRLTRGGLVCATLPARVAAAAELRAAARTIAPRVDAVLIDEPVGGGGLSLSHRAAILRTAGVDVMVALDGRDRNRVAIEGELAALAEIDVAAVLVGSRAAGDADSRGVFDLEEAQLGALARRAGHAVGANDPGAVTGGVSSVCDLRLVGVERAPSRSTEPDPVVPMLAVLPVDLPAGGPAPAWSRAVVEAAIAAQQRRAVVGVHLDVRAGDRAGAVVWEWIAHLAVIVREALG